jgi:hypothetical protein
MFIGSSIADTQHIFIIHFTVQPGLYELKPSISTLLPVKSIKNNT